MSISTACDPTSTKQQFGCERSKNERATRCRSTGAPSHWNSRTARRAPSGGCGTTPTTTPAAACPPSARSKRRGVRVTTHTPTSTTRYWRSATRRASTSVSPTRSRRRRRRSVSTSTVSAPTRPTRRTSRTLPRTSSRRRPRASSAHRRSCSRTAGPSSCASRPPTIPPRRAHLRRALRGPREKLGGRRGQAPAPAGRVGRHPRDAAGSSHQWHTATKK